MIKNLIELNCIKVGNFTLKNGEQSKYPGVMEDIIPCILTSILIANGVYDILCAICILLKGFGAVPAPFTILSELHPTMFAKDENINNEVVNRLLAYWLFTYGFARLIAGIKIDVSSDIIAAITYFLEGGCFEYESRIGKTMLQDKVTFVSIFCVALGIFVLLRPLGVFSTKDCSL
jgi:hypothetical protein